MGVGYSNYEKPKNMEGEPVSILDVRKNVKESPKRKIPVKSSKTPPKKKSTKKKTSKKMKSPDKKKSPVRRKKKYDEKERGKKMNQHIVGRV